VSGTPQLGFQTTSDYILGPDPNSNPVQAAEMAMDANQTLTWLHTNVYAAGALIATYDGAPSSSASAANNTNTFGLHFYFNDPIPGSPRTGLRPWGGLGSRRAQTDAAGVLEQTCASLPFGDGLSCTGSVTTPTEHHFTGKERDTESGNDYFEARYYSSAMGRFMSPDWSAQVEPVPYAKLDNPQTLNLYAYVANNPLAGVDADGHQSCSDAPGVCGAMTEAVGHGANANDVMDAAQQATQPLSDASERAIQNSPLTGTQAGAFEKAVTSAGAANLVNPNTLVGLASKESCINPNAVTGDARGIFQIRPGQQSFLKLTDEQVTSVTGAVPAVANYFGHYTQLFSDRKGADVGESLAIASWTMGVQHTLNVFNKGGMQAVRDTSLGDPQNHRVGDDYIDYVQSFQ
jgi:RHS repeat-associated protein